MTAPFVFVKSGDRAATVAGLRQLADFLESHPDVPVPTRWDTAVSLFTRGYTDTDEPACRAEIDRAAAALGVTAQTEGSHYTVTRDFGPVAYRIVHIPAAAGRAFDARRSYCDVVQLDTDPASDQTGVVS